MVEQLRQRCREDKQYAELHFAIKNQFSRQSLTPYARLFLKLRDELSLDGELVLRGCQIVIPPSAVKDILTRLHSSHQGIEKTKRRARQAVFWPGYSNDIATTIESCEKCQFYRPSLTPEPLIQDSIPSRPFEVVTSDLFQYGSHHFMVYADRLTGFPLLSRFSSSPSSSDLIKELRIFFSIMGVPNTFRSDNGPQYRSRLFMDFLQEWGVKWIPSSPHNHQSNGHAEVTVKIIKHLVAKNNGKIESDAFAAGLLELRNGPRDDGLSPAQRLFGHPLRSLVPSHWRSFDQHWQKCATVADHQRLECAKKRKIYYDRSTKIQNRLPSGTPVLVQNPISKRWDATAHIVGTPDRRRYNLRFPSGRVLWRNRKFIRQLGNQFDEPSFPNPNKPPNNPPEKLRRSTRQAKSPDRLQF